ncbi:uncharacterized protein UV8b_03499 [Ustilaginoidea virens]|uniref:Uncharacterized protein n=1 Tax=Ustilaginoidea virens TaxID=1159556 RepID=A0A8E5HPW5_USTVR|nr:uncharacterized protein UV8b_03499 [Ustilaginoidea virens]QUC19258.1 hypothetical protein UV8b_03499 [Ustilaginoidea virens]
MRGHSKHWNKSQKQEGPQDQKNIRGSMPRRRDSDMTSVAEPTKCGLWTPERHQVPSEPLFISLPNGMSATFGHLSPLNMLPNKQVAYESRHKNKRTDVKPLSTSACQEKQGPSLNKHRVSDGGDTHLNVARKYLGRGELQRILALGRNDGTEPLKDRQGALHRAPPSSHNV